MAFTLIELLVVIAMIGILASLLVPALSGTKERMRRATCRNDMRDASGEDAGFPHACASKNENGTVKRLDRPPLLVVQPLEVRRISIVRTTDERRWPSCFTRRRRDDRRFGYF
jgi:prepilin-type N-terminal cleavage/methylation domain-containing protein